MQRSVPACCTAKEGRSLLAVPDVTTLPGGLARSVENTPLSRPCYLAGGPVLTFALMYG